MNCPSLIVFLSALVNELYFILRPTKVARALSISDLPEPVSPVITEKSSSKLTTISLINEKFFMYNLFSISYLYFQ